MNECQWYDLHPLTDLLYVLDQLPRSRLLGVE